MRDDARLSGARARQNEKRPLLVDYGRLLLGIESVEGVGFGQGSYSTVTDFARLRG